MRITAILITAVLVTAPLAAGQLPEISGWDPSGESMTFSPSTLWEHINGAAETFLQYGFQELTTGELVKAGVTVAVGVYDMGTPLNAFGIYRTERPEGAKTVRVGAEAVVSAPYQALLVKDRFYVKVDVYDGELDEGAGEALVTAIAGALSGSDGMPDAFSALPAPGRIAGSERYTRQAFLGLRELTNCVSAEYGSEPTYRVFAVVPPKGETTDASWQTLSSKWKSTDRNGTTMLVKEVPYTGLVAVTKTSTGIIGVVGFKTEAQTLENLARLNAGS